MENSELKITVFLDTSTLLHSYSIWRNNGKLPIYLTDSNSKKYTFEKCIYESYMAFRGVGGKKPDEGRGDWAQRHLKKEHDPIPVGDLSGKFHKGNSFLSHYWINQIEEFNFESKNRLRDFIINDDLKEFDKEINNQKKLYENNIKFNLLANNYIDFLIKNKVHVLRYIDIFNMNFEIESGVFPSMLDSLVRQTTIPSEDFEIVYAAMRISADLFITTDSRLRVCAASLGLNLPLHPSAFISPDDYAQQVDFLMNQYSSRPK